MTTTPTPPIPPITPVPTPPTPPTPHPTSLIPPVVTPGAKPKSLTETPPATPVPTPEDTQKQSGNTHPELILFSLMAYSYYFAVQHAAKDIKDQQSPTAHGLFHHTQLNYSINMPQKNINDKGDETARKDAENDVDMANAKAAGDPALKRTLGEAGFFDTAEKPVESEAPTPDIDDETLT